MVLLGAFMKYPQTTKSMAVYFRRPVTALLLAGLLPLAMAGQMVSPEIDKQPGPFSYFSKPTDELGVYQAPSGTEVTPEGYLYTGYGELMFFVGPEQTPVSARVRTLEDGYLPVLSYTVTHLGIEYRFTIFSASLGVVQSAGPVVNFVRVTVKNPSNLPRTAFLTTAMRYQAEQTTEVPTGDNRFRRPIEETGIVQFHQPGEAFSKEWTYSCEGDAFLRDGRALYVFPRQPAPRLSLTLRSHYNRMRPLVATKLKVEPTTPASVAAYTVTLAPGASRALDFFMPLEPIQTGTPEFAKLDAARFDDAHREVVAFWRELLGRGMQIELPETKVTDTFRASLIYDLLALNVVDGQFVQTVNQFQYHRFYLRDSADIVRMYDATGYSDIAAQVLSLFPSRQEADGNFLSQPGEYDGWGEALWAFGEHYRRTHDLHFAESVYPLVVRAVDWLVQARAADPLHIMPMSDVKDNEYVAAHLTGYNFLALDGLKSAIELAQATGHTDEARRFQQEYDDYRTCFFKLLDQATRGTDGYIPPSLDGGAGKGTDWGNLLAVTPEPVLDAHDPRVTETLRRVQAQYQEGLATYTEPDDGQFLHHYLTIKNTLTELVRGDQEQVIREFYAELLHTSSTHAGFEYSIRPWGSRDFGGNLAPHGWFAADYRNLLRNMMVREEGDTLHLLSAVSPEWIAKGKTIRVERAPSYFGLIGFALDMPDDGSAVLHLNASFQRPPRKLVLHLPWFMDATAVTADGVAVQMSDNSVELPVSAKEVRIDWHRKPNAATISYAKTVESYKAEYRKRYDHLMATGEMSPATDTWSVPEH
ncbi:MAG: hypothetical protein WCA89_02965 [Terracidiphilus sp.]|jgi:hypothetical protein